MLVLGLDVLFAEKDRTSPDLISQDLEKRNPKIAKLLSKLPSNEFLAMEVMKEFPVVIGHSGLDIEGDAKEMILTSHQLKFLLGKGQIPRNG